MTNARNERPGESVHIFVDIFSDGDVFCLEIFGGLLSPFHYV